MSIPNNSQPPGGYMSPPPPPNSNSSAGCWKAAGITCGVLVLLAIIFTFVMVAVVKKSGLMDTITQAAAGPANGMTIQKAIIAYHDKHGAYPPDLKSLVPDELPDAKILHSDLDSVSKSPDHVSWKYYKPTNDTTAKSPLLRLDYKISVPGASEQQMPVQSIIIDFDGTPESPPAGRPATPFGTAPGSLNTAPGGSSTQ